MTMADRRIRLRAVYEAYVAGDDPDPDAYDWSAPLIAVDLREQQRVERKDVLMQAIADEDAEDLRQAEDEIVAAMLDALERQRRTVLARLTGTKARRSTAYWDPPGEKKLDVRYILDVTKWKQELEAAVRPALGRAAARGAASLRRRLGISVTSSLPETSRAIDTATDSIVNGMVARFFEIQERIRKQEQLQASMADLEKAVNDAYDAKESWARRVSGDATVGVYNQATLETAQQSGRALRKMWLSRRDQKVREHHIEADGQTRPISEPFIVGGHRMQYPGDPDGPISEVANCRCTLVYEVR